MTQSDDYAGLGTEINIHGVSMGARSLRWPATVLFALLVAAGFGVTAIIAGSLAPASAASSGTVYVVHGIAGATADVVLDGKVLQPAAAPKTVIGPLDLAAGTHVLELRTAADPLVSAQFSVGPGESLDVVAHRAADRAMTPVITVFRNDVSPVGPGKTRLVVSHVAVAEPADIRVDGKPYFRNVANAESLSVVVPAGAYSLDVVATATTDKSILDPVRVTLGAGTLTRVFAIGNPEEKTSDAIVQVLGVPVEGAATPSFVRTGDGGQAAEGYVTGAGAVWAATGVTVLGLTLAGVAGARSGAARSARVAGARRRP